ncbi:helix-turn-helix domain-containing protein [Mucilaginibacter aquatilis]|uniref:Helix-turn-helix domain-containing protein n=1 Tax=Mucilaginibacter aquatilis TaxID=1517760 RepID=A0A6I4I5Z0_9SPHI|nr:helix-turn-helix domain-containing protein [Mucilaginibacter aquatilis]MVN90540.1 helix-turn-helix domain-containing protein [Mucilaginibacter aquatilis]
MRLFIVFLFVLLGWLKVNATPDYAFTPINVNNGLSGNQVRNIVQLKDGRMAIVAQGLVNIYDGAKFKYLHYTENNSVNLTGYGGFHHLYVSNNGLVWFKNQHKLYIIDAENNSFVSSPAKTVAALGINSPLSDFFMDNDHRIWCITQNDDLYFSQLGQAKLQIFVKKVSSLSGMAYKVYDVAVLGNKLYLFYQSGMLICFDLSSRKRIYSQQSLTQGQHLKYGSTSFVIPGKQQFFQLRNGAGGGTMLTYNFKLRQWNTVLSTDYWLNYLSVDQGGDIWVSGRDGMWKIDSQLAKKEFIPTLRLVDGEEITTEVSTIYHDNQGGMWMGTLNRGLLYYHPQRFKFKNVGKSLFSLSKADNLNVTAFTNLGNDNLLIGTDRGLFVYNKINTGLKPLHSAKNLKCTALYTDEAGNIWVATAGNGLFILNQRLELASVPSLPGDINTITAYNDSTLILCTRNEGFGWLNTTTRKYSHVGASKQLSFASIKQVIVVKPNLLAGIYNGGFFVYDIKDSKITLKQGDKDYNAIAVDARNQLWLASQDGLQLWNNSLKKTHTFYTSNGLINNFIQSVTQTPDGAMWVGTSGGLTRISSSDENNEKYTLSSFNHLDGIIKNEFCERSAYVDSSGNTYWGGIDGFNILPANTKPFYKKPIAPLLINVQLFNNDVKANTAYDNNVVLKQPLQQTREIKLNYNQNFLSLEYSALNYVNPTQTYYRYQLVGLDEHEQQQQSSDGNGHFSYTNVQPGTYYFKVRAAGNNNQWNNQYAQIKILIKPPLWKTPLAYILYVLVLAGISILSIYIYLKRKRAKLILQQKEDFDSMKAVFLQNVNAELNEPLSHVVHPLNTLIKQVDEGRLKQQLALIYANVLDVQQSVSQLSDEALVPLKDQENALNMEMLLINMRRLLELQQERRLQHNVQNNEGSVLNGNLMTAADEKFLERTLKFVQDNINNPAYTVELLSKDIGMDRTGLYRKLTGIIGKTPTNFIRSVRLKRATELLEQGLSVADVADRVGFSTASYFTKCFQEEYGVKPLQYLASLKLSKPS